MKIRNKKFLFLMIIGLILLSGMKVFAQTCPEKTIVNGERSITFVGGLVDLGGDNQAFVWFEYGTTSGNYTFKTEKKLMTQIGKYCISVENLEPCTTYYYRAVMENKAGPSYGAELAKTTPCSSQGDSTKKVLGMATQVPTGIFKTVFSEYLIFPLLAATFLVLILKSNILKWEEWLDERKKEYQRFKSEKILRQKITKVKREIKNQT
jgi:predicted RNase H-like HicB family nuclease